jgi:dUTP pyrophosphatase
MPIKLKIKKIHKDMKIPAYAHSDDGCFDLCSAENITVNPGERVTIPTGIAMEIPEGFVGFIWDKGGLSHKHGLKTFGGVIDSGYRGEVMVGIANLSNEPYSFEKNHKVAQMFIQKREEIEIEEAEEFSDSLRGENKFGSTGK